MYTVTRYHDISVGHRVAGHESKCRHLHGHNYRVHFTVASRHDLDGIGRVVDFGVIKSKLCDWLETNWDHKFLLWDCDPMATELTALVAKGGSTPLVHIIHDSIVRVPFNPTAENMAAYLVNVVGRDLMADTGAELIEVTIDETRKCSANYVRTP